MTGAAAAIDEKELKADVHRRLVDAVEAGEPPDDVSLRARLAEMVRDAVPLLPSPAVARLVEELVDEVTGLGPLEPLLADPAVSEIMVNGPGDAWIERSGRLERAVVDLDADAILHVVERVISPLGLRLDRTAPIVDARLADGSRLHAVIPPVGVDGPYLTIRRFSARPVPLSGFEVGEEAADFLEWAVVAGWNLLVSGATATGKTTFLNALSAAIPTGERIVTIEDTAELRFTQPHVVRLEARPPNAEGVGGVTLHDLVRAALRMRPDRVVVGEVRGGEALDLLEALSTGHDGSLCTLHGGGPVEALARLEALVLRSGTGMAPEAVRASIAASIDGVVHLARRRDGARIVEAVAEVDGPFRARALFRHRGGTLVPTAPPRRAARRHDAPLLPDGAVRCRSSP